MLIECSRTQIYFWEKIAMAFLTNATKGLSSEINITPLIDVLLVLLIIFMVIVPLAPCGLSTTIPTSGTLDPPTQSAESPLLVQLNGDAAHPVYRIEGAGVDGYAFAIRLRDLMAARASRQMLVQADPQLDFGTVSNVVDAGRAAGAETIGLLTPRSTR
jgi:biopolymer transport protein ExbD